MSRINPTHFISILLLIKVLIKAKGYAVPVVSQDVCRAIL